MLTTISMTPGQAYPTKYHFEHQSTARRQKRARPAFLNDDEPLAKRARLISPHNANSLSNTTVAGKDAGAMQEAGPEPTYRPDLCATTTTKTDTSPAARDDSEDPSITPYDEPVIITYIGKGKARAIDVPPRSIPRTRRNPFKYPKTTAQDIIPVSPSSTPVHDIVLDEGIPLSLPLAELGSSTTDVVMCDANDAGPSTPLEARMG